jgi:hypothetical protein
MMRIRVVPVMVLGIAFCGGCSSSSSRPRTVDAAGPEAGSGGDNGGSGGGGAGGAGGAGGGGAGGVGGAGGSGGAGGAIDSGAIGAADTAPAGADSGSPDVGVASGDAKAGPPVVDGFDFTGCMTVMSGLTPAQFCGGYGIVCGFGTPGHFPSAAACMSKFKGGSSDSDSCNAGKLCNAANGIKDKEMNCKMAAYTIPCMRNY